MKYLVLCVLVLSATVVQAAPVSYLSFGNFSGRNITCGIHGSTTNDLTVSDTKYSASVLLPTKSSRGFVNYSITRYGRSMKEVSFTCFDITGALKVVMVKLNNAAHFLAQSAGTYIFGK